MSPRMVGAANSSRVTLAFQQFRATVSTDIGKRRDGFIFLSNHKNGLVNNLVG
ncbi:MAG: hypothetical protein ACJA0I_001479 [Gammaproteobacteria bacterium]